MITPSTPQFDPDTRVVWNPDHLAAEIDGQVVVMSLAQGKYIGLNDMATTIWRRLEHPKSVSDLVGDLVRDFDGDAIEIQRDSLDLLGHLYEVGLIQIDTNGAPD